MLDSPCEHASPVTNTPSQSGIDGSLDAWHESLAMALHDLSGAMSVVHGTVQLWRLGGRLHTSPSEDWESVHAASDRAVRLSRELLGLCRVHHSQFQPDCQPEEIVQLVVELIHRRRAAFEAAAQHLWIETPEDAIWLLADRELLERALDNLLDNAAKYTPEDGHIIVSVERRESQAVVRVRDTGVGIAPEFLPRVFDPFSRENTLVVRRRSGSGVGLFAVRRIVELHGGRVSVDSPGQGMGSEFTIRLPAHQFETSIERT